MNNLSNLLEQEIPRLRRYARALVRDAHSADDLVQECLLRAWSRAHLWQPGTNLRAWLFTILHNIHVNRIRSVLREGRAVKVEHAEGHLVCAPSQLPRVELRDLQEALYKLPEEQRTVILLVGLEGLPYDTVAEILSVPVGTVRSRLSRARQALRRLMDSRTAERPAANIDEPAAERQARLRYAAA
jgi:RNA polymerase sigma-70 factor (ECF subfamily)